MSNNLEQANGLDPRDASDRGQDAGGDGFSNAEEAVQLYMTRIISKLLANNLSTRALIEAELGE